MIGKLLAVENVPNYRGNLLKVLVAFLVDACEDSNDEIVLVDVENLRNLSFLGVECPTGDFLGIVD